MLNKNIKVWFCFHYSVCVWKRNGKSPSFGWCFHLKRLKKETTDSTEQNGMTWEWRHLTIHFSWWKHQNAVIRKHYKKNNHLEQKIRQRKCLNKVNENEWNWSTSAFVFLSLGENRVMEMVQDHSKMEWHKNGGI